MRSPTCTENKPGGILSPFSWAARQLFVFVAPREVALGLGESVDFVSRSLVLALQLPEAQPVAGTCLTVGLDNRSHVRQQGIEARVNVRCKDEGWGLEGTG